MDSGKARVVLYDYIKYDIPVEMNVSSIAGIPHKSKAFRSILDLSFALQLIPQVKVPSVNKNTEKTAPAGAIYQIRHVLLCIIHAFAQAP